MNTSTYRYTECGLDNVEIKGMHSMTDDAGEAVYGVTNILGLHKAISHGIITKTGSIGADELRFLRTEMGLTQAELAQIVKKEHQTIGRWERGESPIDRNAEALIRLTARERLDLDTNMTTEEIAAKCVPSATLTVITIDGSDPENYHPVAA